MLPRLLEPLWVGEGYEQVNNERYGTLAEQMAVPGFGAAPAPGALTRCRSPGRQPRQRLVAAAEARQAEAGP